MFRFKTIIIQFYKTKNQKMIKIVVLTMLIIVFGNIECNNNNYLNESKLKSDLLNSNKYNPYGFPTNDKLKVEIGMTFYTPYDLNPNH